MTEVLYNDEFPGPRRAELALVVDDNVAMRALMARLLTAAGYRVLQAENGADGLDVLRTSGGDVALVVTDVLMPEMNGDHFARLVWRERPDMPIVFVSGQEPDDDVQELLAGGTSAFLAKPFSREAIQVAIASVRAAIPRAGSGG